jgi:glucan phosphoethanolaminetransferase (alkaline phosphatase superfamily)
MKKYEVAAIVLVVLYIISSIANPLYTMFLAKFYGANVMSTLSLHQYAISSLHAVLKLLVGIAIAVWLGRQAKKDGASPAIWALFGLFFWVLGAILYFVLRSQKDSSSEVGELHSF